MKTVTFYSNTRYAGGRSHRNISTLEFVEDKDILQAAEHYGYNIYPSQGEDFENGINDANGNEVMDAEDFKKFSETNIGRLEIGETIFSSDELKNISVNEFKVLPKNYQLEYINIWYEDVTAKMLDFAKERYSLEDAFEFSKNQWQEIREEEENETAGN
jgi:hypothetical protein